MVVVDESESKGGHEGWMEALSERFPQFTGKTLNLHHIHFP